MLVVLSHYTFSFFHRPRRHDQMNNSLDCGCRIGITFLLPLWWEANFLWRFCLFFIHFLKKANKNNSQLEMCLRYYQVFGRFDSYLLGWLYDIWEERVVTSWRTWSKLKFNSLRLYNKESSWKAEWNKDNLIIKHQYQEKKKLNKCNNYCSWLVLRNKVNKVKLFKIHEMYAFQNWKFIW